MYLIEDDWKKESKQNALFLIISIVCIVFCFISETENSIRTICVAFGIFFLYGFLYSIIYKVKVSAEKILLRTLFRRVEINIKDIKYYICKRYRKSEFYQFRLYLEKKSVLINIRYRDKFNEILKQNDIEERSIKKNK